MRVKKFLKINLKIIILVGILFWILSNKSYAYTDVVTASNQTYDYVISHLDEYKILQDGIYGNVYTANKTWNVACTEVEQNGIYENNKLQYLQGYILINADGTATVRKYSSSSNYTDTSVTNNTDVFKIAARMCYYVSEGFEEYRNSQRYFSSSSNSLGSNTANTYNALRGWYNQYAGSYGFQTNYKNAYRY